MASSRLVGEGQILFTGVAAKKSVTTFRRATASGGTGVHRKCVSAT